MSAPEQVSIQQLRAAFECGTPTVVRNSLLPFLRLEYNSTGAVKPINEIVQSISKLVYPWFLNSTAMRQDEKDAMYELIRPDGRLVKLLLRYYMLQRGQSSLGDMMIAVDAMPAEYHSQIDIGPEYAKRVVKDAQKDNKVVGFRVGALEYFLYHLCKAMLPPRESTVGAPPALDADQRPRKTFFAPAGSTVHLLVREYIEMFVPVAVPGVTTETPTKTDNSPIGQIRNRLHDFSPMKHNELPKTTRTPGTMEADILDTMDYNATLELTGYFVATTVLLWMPIVPADVRAAIATGKPDWIWIPNNAHLAGLNMFHMLVSYFSKGERQMEQFHVPGPNGSNSKLVANGTRIGMNGSIRNFLRTRTIVTSIEDMLGLVLGSCNRAGTVEVDVWLAMLHNAAQVWIRFALPWRSTAPPPAVDMTNVWGSRVAAMTNNMATVLYGQVFSLFIKQLTDPNTDLLARCNTLAEGKNDLLSVIDRVLSSFTDQGLRSVLYIIEQYQLDANLHMRSQFIAPREPPIWESTGAGSPENGSPVRDARHETRTPFEQQVLRMHPGVMPYAASCISMKCNSQVLQRVLIDEFGNPPLVSVFTRPGRLMLRLVRALHTTDLLAVRQLRLIVPQDTADQAKTVAHDIFAVIQRILSATGDSSGSLNLSSTNSAAQRSRQLQEVQKRINAMYGKIKAVFGVSSGMIREITERIDESMSCNPAYADRPKHDSRITEPEMSHGMLTQRGRWQLKTGRRKFTAQSLMQAPKIVGLHEEYEARSYESQWVLDRIPQTNECMNHWYQELLAAINGKVTVPQPMLDYKLDFRWIAAYRNMRFLAISLIVFLFFWKLFG